MSLPVLIGHRFELDQILIEMGDKDYLTRRLAELYDEAPGNFRPGRGFTAPICHLSSNQRVLASNQRVSRPTRTSNWCANDSAQLVAVKQAEDQVYRTHGH